MELINFIGAQASKDGKWLLVTFGRKDTDEKVRWLVPFNAKKGPCFADADDDKAYLNLPMKKKEEEPKQEEHPKCLENLVCEDIPF